jgi:hypothetical protein
MAGYGGVGATMSKECRRNREKLTGVLSVVRVLLALVESVLLLHLLNLRVGPGALVVLLVDTASADV